jgi:hypothetical protein
MQEEKGIVESVRVYDVEARQRDCFTPDLCIRGIL